MLTNKTIIALAHSFELRQRSAVDVMFLDAVDVMFLKVSSANDITIVCIVCRCSIYAKVNKLCVLAFAALEGPPQVIICQEQGDHFYTIRRY